MEPSTVSQQEARKQLLNAKDRLSKLDSDANPDMVAFWAARVKALEGVVVSESRSIPSATSAPTPATSSTVLERYWPSPSRSRVKHSVYCLCGCGTLNKPRSHFVRGHTRRLARRLEDIERGIGTVADLPLIVRNVLLDPGQTYFSLCSRCGNPYIGKGGRDVLGNHLGPICSRL